jgi:DNA-directed RNA polymerase subunit K/omega
MKPEDLAKAQNPDLRGSLAAMLRAANLARQIAVQTDTAIVMSRDGKPVRVTAEELRNELITVKRKPHE